MDNLKIIFASPEAVPFVKTGGLADVSGMLPRMLARMGHSVKVIIPKYGTIPQPYLDRFHLDVSFDISIAGTMHTLQLYRSADATLHLEYLLIGNDYFYSRPEPYVDPETGLDYVDNDERFIFFCRGILEVLRHIDWKPDIIHANDWQTALLPTYLATLFKNDSFYSRTRSVFTIHNMGYQGQFAATSFAKLGLPDDLFYATGPFEYWGKVNFMKSAIAYATLLSTVSPRYAIEIQSDNEYGCGLEGVLHARARDLFGIINGVDYSDWSPEHDKYIPYRFSPANLTAKKRNKVELIGRLNLPYREKSPLIGMITRLVDQKGFDIIAKAATDLFSLDLQMAVLGTGDQKYHRLLTDLEKKYPDKLKIYLKYDNEMAHWIEAGADMFLMPSRYEPCGLNQLYSLRYGTVPIVRATGGLADTIIDVSPDNFSGTGLVFEKYDAASLLSAVKRALAIFSRKKLWRKVMKEAMGQDFSWQSSAQKYSEMYQKALSEH